MKLLSSVWKNPPISPKIALVSAAPAGTKSEINSESDASQPETKGQFCKEGNYDDLVQVMETNLLAAAKLKASTLEQEAAKQAMNIVNEAREQSVQLRQQAEEQGYNEGYQAGYQAGQEKAKQLVNEAAELVEKAQKEREKLLTELEPQALELAFAIAERILRREVARSPEAIAELLAAAAEKLPEGEAVVVEVAPGEGAVWTSAQNMIQEALADRSFQIVENTNVSPGEFILSSEAGIVDARIKTQLEVCRTHLLGENAYDEEVVSKTGS